MKKINAILLISALFVNFSCSQKSGMSDQVQSKQGYPALDHKVININDYGSYLNDNVSDRLEIATLAGGCFWCTEAAFERINGVVDVISGYSGGEEEYPTYTEVCAKATGHAEAINIYFDPEIIGYEKLLEILFVAHDPTQLNRQGNDIGPQYRSAIFYHSPEQQTIAESFIAKEQKKPTYGKPIVTELSAYTNFWVAEGYHQNFYELNPNQGYVRAVSRPKVEKVMKTFQDILKSKFTKV